MIPGKGVVGKIWLTGCVFGDCLVDLPNVTMIVRTPKMKFIRKETITLRPHIRPFLVDGKLNLKWNEKGGFIEVWIKVGRAVPQLLLSGKDPDGLSRMFFCQI